MRSSSRTRVLVLGWLALIASAAVAEVKPHPLFSDNMVLQQGKPVPVWGTAADGEQVTVKVAGQEASATTADGRWMVRLAPLAAGGPLEMTISGANTITIRNVLVGEVWVCSGQSNMQFGLAGAANGAEAIKESADAGIRLLTVPRVTSDEPLDTADAKWVECGPDTSGGFSAVGYFFGKHLRAARGVPVGLINSSWGGTPAEAWTSWHKLVSTPGLEGIYQRYQQALVAYPANYRKWQNDLATWQEQAAAAKRDNKPVPRQPGMPMGPRHQNRPACLYNGMIAPLIPYAIAGAIWYQGESNAGRAYEYRTLFPAMITDWRERWGQGDFPFLFVQLASFMDIHQEPMESTWAELREAQTLTLDAVPNAGMAVITDLGEEKDIHPKQKEPVGERLALAARHIAYGEDLVWSSPMVERAIVMGGKIRLRFAHAGTGLTAKDGPDLTGFTICGRDRIYHNAQARIVGRREVDVWSPEVPAPMAVRLGWANFPLINLYNSAGLPASPCRTDDFPITSGPK